MEKLLLNKQRKRKVICSYFVFNIIHGSARKRKYWVHPFNSARLLKGSFVSMFGDLREDETKFFNYFRMTIRSFDELAAKISENVKCQNTAMRLAIPPLEMRLAIPPLEMIAVTLRYLGSWCNLIDLHYSYRIGQSTLSKITRKVCSAIWTLMREECIPATFNQQMWLETAGSFERRANFPNCLGAIDGKHIRIVKPSMSGSEYYNYKNFFSVVLFAVADANYRFLYIDVGSVGKEGDSTIFARSQFFKQLENAKLSIPPGKPLPGTGGPVMPYIFVGDEAFSLSNHVLRPYSGKFLSREKRVFNYRLSRARRYVECSFGILSNKWRIFHKAINVNLQFAIDIIKCCCVLHNFVIARDGYQEEDSYCITGLFDIENEPASVPGGRNLNFRRNEFTKHFVSDIGKLPWQDKCV